MGFGLQCNDDSTQFQAYIELRDEHKRIEGRVSMLKFLDSPLSSLKVMTVNYRFLKIWRLKDIDGLEIEPSGSLVPAVNPTGHTIFKESLNFDYKYANEITHVDVSDNDEYVMTATRCSRNNSIQKWSLEKPMKSIVLWEKMRDEDIILDDLWDKLEPMCALRFHLQRDNCYGFSTKWGDIKYVDSRYSCNSAPTQTRSPPAAACASRPTPRPSSGPACTPSTSRS